MSRDIYTTIRFSDQDSRSKILLLWLILACSFIAITLHIYFIYTSVNITHVIKTGREQILLDEYAYQESKREYLEALRGIKQDHSEKERFVRISNPDFVSRTASFVFQLPD